MLRRVCILFAFCLLTGPAYPWGSAGGGTHLNIDKAAYEMLKNTSGFNSNNFPDINTIDNYTGTVRGADAVFYAFYEEYKYSNHYYNPKNGQGNAPHRAAYWYDVLVQEIKKGNANKSSEAAKAAAYLAHYVADVGVPYHVNERGHMVNGAGYKDWYDPEYKTPPQRCRHTSWEIDAHGYSKNTTGYSGMSRQWNICRLRNSGKARIDCFVRAVAKRTQDTSKSSNITYPNVMKDLVRRSMQDVYTVYKAAYDEGTAGITGSSTSSSSGSWWRRRWDSWRR